MAIDKGKFLGLLGNTAEARSFVASLDATDILILQLYYKWVTQQVAKNVGIIELITDEARREEYMKSYGASDWQFAGIIDHLYQGAVHCSHVGSSGGSGHALRYAYYAYSPSLNKELVFGKTCMGQFLGVDNITLDRIQKILEITDLEVRDALSYGRFSKELLSRTYYTMLYALKTNRELNESFVKKLGKTAVELFLNFIHSGFMLPHKLDVLVTEAFMEATKEVIWQNPKVVLFDNKAGVQTVLSECETLQVNTTQDTKTFEPWQITKDVNMSYIAQMPFRKALAALTINAYLCGTDFARNIVDISDFTSKVGILLEKTKDLPTKGVSAGSLLCDYLIEYETLTPGDVILNAFKTGVMANIITFFCVHDSDGILEVVNTYYDDILTAIENDGVNAEATYEEDEEDDFDFDLEEDTDEDWEDDE